MERVIQGRKIDTGDRVIIFTRIAINIPSYVYVRGWRAFVNYRGRQKTCRVCGDFDHLAKDSPKARRQQDPKQPGAKPQGEHQDQPSSPPSHSNTEDKPSRVTQEETMDTQNTNVSVRNEINITEPDPEVLKSCLDDVFVGSVSTDPGMTLKASVQLKNIRMLNQRSRLLKPGLTQNKKQSCRLVLSLVVLAVELILTLKFSVLLHQAGMPIREKILRARTASQVRFLSGKRGILKLQLRPPSGCGRGKEH